MGLFGPKVIKRITKCDPPAPKLGDEIAAHSLCEFLIFDEPYPAKFAAQKNDL